MIKSAVLFLKSKLVFHILTDAKLMKQFGLHVSFVTSSTSILTIFATLACLLNVQYNSICRSFLKVNTCFLYTEITSKFFVLLHCEEFVNSDNFGKIYIVSINTYVVTPQRPVSPRRF